MTVKEYLEKEAKETTRKRRLENKIKRGVAKQYYVYYLPEENYVGMTNDFESRVKSHKNNNKRNVDGARILRVFDNPFDAHIYETQWHSMGARGFNTSYYLG